MLAAPPAVSRRVAAAFDVSFAVDAGASAASAAAAAEQQRADEPTARRVRPDGALSDVGTSRRRGGGGGAALATAPRVAQPDLPSVETARVLAHSLEETARGHRALYRDLEDVETVAAALGTLVREQARALSLAPTLHPLVRVLELLKHAVHGLAAQQPAEFGRFRPEEYLSTVTRATDRLAGLVKRVKRELKRAERAAAAEQSGVSEVASARRRTTPLCEILLGSDQLASQFWSIAFGGDTFEVKRASFASCCGRVIEQEWLDVQLVERSLDRYDRGLISQLDLSEFVDKHGGMVRGFAAVCMAGQSGPYAWGANRKGECGPADEFGDSCAEPMQIGWELGGSRIRQVDCDAGITAAVLDNGDLYTWGSVTGGKLGRDEPFGPGADDQAPGVDGVPRKVEALGGCRIAFVSCGASYAAAVTDDGQLFTWGSFGGDDHAPTLGHRHGEVLMGTEDGNHYSPVPIAVRALRSMHVTQVSCGPEHAAAVTAHGQTYSWGSGDRGRLGIGSEVDAWAPQQVADLAGKRVVQVACGTVHTLALTVRGELFVWGGARSGKLGLGGVGFCDTFVQKTRTGQPFVPRPKNVSALAAMHVTHISAGRAHSLAVTEQGALYTWGCGKDGKLGHGGVEAEWLPRRVSSMLTVSVIQASCGREHTSAVTGAGWLFSWGRGVRGKLGVGSEEDIDRPARVTRLPGPAYQVACGRHHTVAIVGQKSVSNEAVALYERQLQTVLLQAVTETAGRAHHETVEHVQSHTRVDRAVRSSRTQARQHGPHLETRRSMPHRAVFSDEGDSQLASVSPVVLDSTADTEPGPHFRAGSNSGSEQLPEASAPGTAPPDVEHEQHRQVGIPSDDWQEKFEREQVQNSMLQQQLEQLRAAHAAGTPAGHGRAGEPFAMPDLNATMDELREAKSEEVAGLREITEGQRKKLAAAVTYTRVYQNLEALQQTRPSDVEPLLQEVTERMVELRSELDEKQLQNALQKEQLLPEGDWSPEPSVRSPSIDRDSARMVAPPSPHPPAAVAHERPAPSIAASSRDSPTASQRSQAPSSVDLVEKSVLLFKSAKDYEPEQKRDSFVEGIAMLERALNSGNIKAAAVEGTKKTLQGAQKKKLELDAQVEQLKQQSQ